MGKMPIVGEYECLLLTAIPAPNSKPGPGERWKLLEKHFSYSHLLTTRKLRQVLQKGRVAKFGKEEAEPRVNTGRHHLCEKGWTLPMVHG